MPDILDDADEIVGFTDAPSEQESKSLSELGAELFRTDSRMDELARELAALGERKKELTTRLLPDYMMKIKQDRIGLEEFGVDLVLEDFFHANIAADWEPERREAAFAWLEDNGHGDLIKTTVSAAFPRRAMGAARWLQAAIQGIVDHLKKAGAHFYEIPELSIEMGVPWNTLTAFCKEQVREGNELPVETLGLTIGKVVKIKERKSKKSKKG